MDIYEKVEINTPPELARHLVNEGDLYFGEDKTRIGVNENCTEGSPFVVFHCTGDVGIYMDSSWNTETHTYYKKLNWCDCIPEGKKVPCYVSDINPTPNTADGMTHIQGYCSGDTSPYKGLYNAWKYATPIPVDELWVPEL